MAIKIEKFHSDNIQAGSRLVYSILASQFANVYSQKGMDKLIDFYAESNIQKRMNEKDTTFFQFVNEENSFAGIAEIENIHIVTLFIDEKYKGQSGGSNFFKFLVDQKYVSDVITVYTTPITIEFYIKNGFVPESINLKEEHGILFMPMKKIIEKK